MSFDFFVLPFFLGLLTLFVMLGVKYGRWIKGLDAADKALIRDGIWSGQVIGRPEGGLHGEPAAS